MMQNKFQQHLSTAFPELLSSPFIIAISGGVDSVVLAHLCHALNLNFALAHCNFQLRDSESDADEAFVKHLAEALNCEIFVKKFDTKAISKDWKTSIQVTARNLRYAWFQHLIEDTNYAYLLTAHHLNDNLETFMINLSRSTGLKGLTGIPLKNKYIRRPLLNFSKEDIKSFAASQNISWREDQSNLSTQYVRNQIRHEVVPALTELSPQFLKHFKTTLEHLSQSEQLLEDYSNLLFKTLVQNSGTHYKIDIEKLNEFPNPKAILYQLLEGFGFSEWDDVVHLKDAQTGKKVLSNTHQLIKDRRFLVLSTLETKEIEDLEIKKTDVEIKTDTIHLRLQKQHKMDELKKEIAYIDASKLKFPLRIRPVNHGDYFYPLGMKGKKKLSDFLKDEKVSPLDKSTQLLLCNTNGDIVWVINQRIDERYKVENGTKIIYKIEYLT